MSLLKRDVMSKYVSAQKRILLLVEEESVNYWKFQLGREGISLLTFTSSDVADLSLKLIMESADKVVYIITKLFKNIICSCLSCGFVVGRAEGNGSDKWNSIDEMSITDIVVFMRHSVMDNVAAARVYGRWARSVLYVLFSSGFYDDLKVLGAEYKDLVVIDEIEERDFVTEMEDYYNQDILHQRAVVGLPRSRGEDYIEGMELAFNGQVSEYVLRDRVSKMKVYEMYQARKKFQRMYPKEFQYNIDEESISLTASYDWVRHLVEIFNRDETIVHYHVGNGTIIYMMYWMGFDVKVHPRADVSYVYPSVMKLIREERMISSFGDVIIFDPVWKRYPEFLESIEDLVQGYPNRMFWADSKYGHIFENDYEVVFSYVTKYKEICLYQRVWPGKEHLDALWINNMIIQEDISMFFNENFISLFSIPWTERNMVKLSEVNPDRGTRVYNVLIREDENFSNVDVVLDGHGLFDKYHMNVHQLNSMLYFYYDKYFNNKIGYDSYWDKRWVVVLEGEMKYSDHFRLQTSSTSASLSIKKYSKIIRANLLKHESLRFHRYKVIGVEPEIVGSFEETRYDGWHLNSSGHLFLMLLSSLGPYDLIPLSLRFYLRQLAFNYEGDYKYYSGWETYFDESHKLYIKSVLKWHNIYDYLMSIYMYIRMSDEIKQNIGDVYNDDELNEIIRYLTSLRPSEELIALN